MSDRAQLQRAQHLLSLDRADEAEELLCEYLVGDPDDPLAHALRSVAARERKDHAAAIEYAERAVGLAPDWGVSHNVLAHALLTKKKLGRAEASAREALRLDPAEGDFYATLARIEILRSRYREALEACDQGLAVDSDHADCARLRSLALSSLGETALAVEAAQGQLGNDPDSSTAHATQGWAQLNAGDYKAARTHFREALRLDPDDEFARRGVLEALKAGNPVYRPVLRYLLWMQRFSGRAQLFMVVGAFLAFRFVSGIRDSVEGTSAAAWAVPLLTTLIVLYLVWVATSWFAVQLANACVLLHPLGWRVVTGRERIEALAITGLLVVSLGLWCFTPYQNTAFTLALLCAPIQCSTFVPLGPQYRWAAMFTAAMVLFAAVFVQADVRAVQLGFRSESFRELVAYETEAQQLSSELQRLNASGQEVGAGLAERIERHEERSQEMSQREVELLPAIRVATSVNDYFLLYAILCVWVSQFLAGALVARSPD